MSSNGYNLILFIHNHKVYSATGSDIYGTYTGRSYITSSPKIFGVDKLQPLYFKNDSIPIQCIGGLDASLILFKDGQLWGFGRNYNGNLGIGNSTPQPFPILLKNNIKNILSNSQLGGYNSANCTTFIQDNDGYVWASGFNAWGSMGLGNSNKYETFTRLDWIGNDFKKFWHTGSTRDCSIVQFNDNNLYVCGRNQQGNLGLGNNTDIYTPIDASDRWFGANNKYEILNVQGGGDLRINNNTFERNTMFILYRNDSGNTVLRASGNNSYGQLAKGDSGDSTGINTPRTINIQNQCKQMVCLGYWGNTLLCVQESGLLQGWGNNFYNQLGYPNSNQDVVRNLTNDVVEVVNTDIVGNQYGSVLTTFIRKTDGYIYTAGYNEHGECGLGFAATRQPTFQKVLIDDYVQKIYSYSSTADARDRVFLFITNNNDLYVCGSNANQGITMRTLNNINTPIKVHHFDN